MRATATRGVWGVNVPLDWYEEDRDNDVSVGVA